MSEYKNMSELKEAFYKTKKRVRGVDIAVNCGIDIPLKGGYYYLGDAVWVAELADDIAKHLEARYYIAIENQEFMDNDLDVIESILLDRWCKHEFLKNPFDDDYRIQEEVNDLMLNESEEKNV